MSMPDPFATPTSAPVKKPDGKSLFPWFLMVAGLPFLLLGGWGIYQGMATRSWPRAEGMILASNLRVRESESTRSSNSGIRDRSETATVDIRYKYTVNGTRYESDGIEVADFGLQNSAAARKQHEKYPPGTVVQVAYNPANPAVAYLEPGPGSVSMMLAGVGTGLVLVGLMVRNAMRHQANRPAEDDEDGN
jgi:hypothetical protein